MLHLESDLIELKVRRRPVTPKPNGESPPMLMKPVSKLYAQYVMVFREVLGRLTEEITRKTAKIPDIQLTGERRPCAPCS